MRNICIKTGFLPVDVFCVKNVGKSGKVFCAQNVSFVNSVFHIEGRPGGGG